MSDRNLVTISSGSLTARINPMGAELWSLTDANGAEYMTDADPAFWGGHAPVLFPVVGSVAHDHIRVGGTEYQMPRHGFARRSLFVPVLVEADHARFRLVDSLATRSAYPFSFVLELDYRVNGMTLEVEAWVTNTNDDDALPFSFGYHPAFAWPLPGGADKAAHKLVFQHDEPGDIRRVSKESGLLLPESEPTPVRGRELVLSSDLFQADAMIWIEPENWCLSYGADGGSWLHLAFPECSALGLWQVPGAKYICIEPWAGHADPVGFTGDFREKPEIMENDLGETRGFRMWITVSPA